jgi:hypothetical protein
VIACSFFRGYSQLKYLGPARRIPAFFNPLGNLITSFFPVILRPEDRIAAIARRAFGSEFGAKGGRVKIWFEEKKKALESGKVGWAVLWLLGVPIPVLLVLFLLRGCT